MKLIITDSYFNIFPLLVENLRGKEKDLSLKNLVFCEEKISLMAERWICGELNGSFNTDVYSFGNFLRAKMPLNNALSKEGSSMAIKRLLSTLQLKRLRASSTHISPSLYELIAQLKSAKVSYIDLQKAVDGVKGTLKEKLADIALVYKAYEEFLKERGYDDQSSALSYLPQVIATDKDIKNTDAYLIGYSSWTSQAREVISSLLDNAKSVTAILTGGENTSLYVNETIGSLVELCNGKGVKVVKEYVGSGYTEESGVILRHAFNPSALPVRDGKLQTQKVTVGCFKNKEAEITAIAEEIVKGVQSGAYRWRDATVALADANEYREEIERIFGMLGVPYFFDEKRKAYNHPLITLILNYIDAFRKNMERNALAAFYKNPLFWADKDFLDDFENYVIKYNVNYFNIKQPFTIVDDKIRSLDELNAFRERVCACFERFDVKTLLQTLKVEDKLSALATALKSAGEVGQSAITEQIYGAVSKLLGEMELMLGEVKLPFVEYKNVFLSGVDAMDLSIIPQYLDAVFVGGFKETALAKAKRLFVCGLTSNVPTTKTDVAILTDGDIDALGGLNVLVEPKIRVVNHRARENAGLALSAFTDALYLTYPATGGTGEQNVKSELVTLCERYFTCKAFGKTDGYLTKAQGIDSFAKDCGRYLDGRIDDFTTPSSFSVAIGGGVTEDLLGRAGKQLALRLNGNRKSIIGGEISASVIEEFQKCPYKAFVTNGLKLKERDEGSVSNISAGNVIHEILRRYVARISEVSDETTSNNLFEKVLIEVLQMPEYGKFKNEVESSVALEMIIDESRKYCYKTYLALSKTKFNESSTEVSFGDGDKCKYPSVKLLGGKVRLKGKIDRVDSGKDYFRIIDYKTGGDKSMDDSNGALYSGTKLQLYLYASAVRGGKEGDKTLAGLYYMPVNDKYISPDAERKMAKGKTLNDENAVKAQDPDFYENGYNSEVLPVHLDKRNNKPIGLSTKEEIDARINYALKISASAASKMQDGVMAVTPYEDACTYCQYNSMCGFDGKKFRKVGSVDEKAFNVDGGENNDG